MKRYAVVGFGCAGYHGAKAIREADPAAVIHVYSEHGEAPYNPMLTTYYAAGKLRDKALFPFGELTELRHRLGLFLCTGYRVNRVDAQSRTVVLEDGSSRDYDGILIATGARAVCPPFPEADPRDLFLMRTLQDARSMRDRLEQGGVGTALVVGASMAGIKVAELLRGQGVQVTLADAAPGIFPLAAYPDVARHIQERVEAAGIAQRYGYGVESLRSTPDGMECAFSDGVELRADLAALCIGTRANVEVVDPGEISVNRGIVVDERMRTTAPGIWAAGDCCAGKDLLDGSSKVIGLWANAGWQGACAGADMAGGAACFSGNIPHNITHFLGMDFIGMGDNNPQGDALGWESTDGRTLIKVVVRDGRLAGVNILDNYRISGVVKNYFYGLLEGGAAAVPALQRGLLAAEGVPERFVRELEAMLHD